MRAAPAAAGRDGRAILAKQSRDCFASVGLGKGLPLRWSLATPHPQQTGEVYAGSARRLRIERVRNVDPGACASGPGELRQQRQSQGRPAGTSGSHQLRNASHRKAAAQQLVDLSDSCGEAGKLNTRTRRKRAGNTGFERMLDLKAYLGSEWQGSPFALSSPIGACGFKRYVLQKAAASTEKGS